METALYLIPVTLGNTPFSQVLPSYNHDIIVQIKYFIVENVNTACKFLSRVDPSIHTNELTFYELNEHTNRNTIGNYLDPLLQEQSMGVISEAGCPAVADPGADIVALAQKKNIKVVPLVGPSSMILAVMASGLSGQSFAFNGYLPAKPEERANKLRSLEARSEKESQTQLFIETPYRNARMMDTILGTCRPDTLVCIAAGITTDQEYIHTKTVAEWKKEVLPDLSKVPAIFLLYRNGTSSRPLAATSHHGSKQYRHKK